MRLGVSSRGNTWVSMGCLGWLILGPFILAWYAIVIAMMLVIWLCMGIGRLIQIAMRKD